MYFLKHVDSTFVYYQYPSSQSCSSRQCFIPDDNNSKLQRVFLDSENSSKSSAEAGALDALELSFEQEIKKGVMSRDLCIC